MNAEKLRRQSFVRIRGESFQIVGIQRERTFLDPVTGSGGRLCILFLLHSVVSGSLLPTHKLLYFPDSKELFLVHDNREVKVSEHEIIAETTRLPLH